MGLWVFNDCCSEEFHGIVFSIEKIHRDGRQQVKGGSNQPSAKQLQLRVGVNPLLLIAWMGLWFFMTYTTQSMELFLCLENRIRFIDKN